MFVKYQHLEKLRATECEGIMVGDVYVFYKIDGTNASMWLNEDGTMGCGSRNRELALDNDNAGFMNWAVQQEKFKTFFATNPTLRLFGEWLVPHSLKTYRESAWRDFYVFDVLDGERYMRYEEYKPLLEAAGINYIPPVCIIKNPSKENIFDQLEKSGEYLVKEGDGYGEGLVIKNYDFVNKYGRTVWGKLITNEFKETAHKTMGAPVLNGTRMIEQEIVEEFCTTAFVEKEHAKLVTEAGEWSSRMIPKLLGVVWYEFIREESWNFIKKHKNPSIDFSLLNKLVLSKTKKVIGI